MREVVQLLKDYRSWHTPYGGASPTDSTLNLEAAGSYGPAGLIVPGQAFDKEGRRMYGASYEALDRALDELLDEDLDAYLVLIEPYLGDPADASIVERWRKSLREWQARREEVRQAAVDLGYPELPDRWQRDHPEPERYTSHQKAVRRLAELLEDVELYVVFPKRMTSREAGHVDQRNGDLYALYRQLRTEGLKKTRAVTTAADMCGYSSARAWEIVRLREGKPA